MEHVKDSGVRASDSSSTTKRSTGILPLCDSENKFYYGLTYYQAKTNRAYIPSGLIAEGAQRKE